MGILRIFRDQGRPKVGQIRQEFILRWRDRVLETEKPAKQRDKLIGDFRAAFREQMPVCRRFAYLDHAAVAPLPSPTGEAIRRWLDQAVEEGDVPWLQWSANLAGCRNRAAELLRATPDEIALVPNTTLGIHCVAAGYPWQSGDRMIALGNEFPSNLLPWKQLAAIGVEVDIYQPAADGRVDIDEILKRITGATRLVAISWVGFVSGYRLDVKQLATRLHERGVLLMLDAIQGLGVYDLDVQSVPVDFVVADGHKWLLGPEGAGILFIRKPHLSLLRPVGVGWNSVQGSFSFAATELNFRDSAARYEGGSHNMAGFAGLNASLGLMQEMRAQYGVTIWEDAVLDLAEYAEERLRECGAEFARPSVREEQSGIISFSWRGQDPQRVRQCCLEAGVVLSCRLGRLRIAMHGYNQREDIDRLVAALLSNSA